MGAAVTTLEAADLDLTASGAPPRLAPGVELLGPYRDSGLQNPPYLLARAGRIVQVSRLLHAVAAAADGTRSFAEVAAVAAREIDRPLTGEQVRFLVRNKLAPAGILTFGDGTAGPPAPGGPNPPPVKDKRLLALRYRRSVVSSEAMDAAARHLEVAFRPRVVIGMLAAIALLDVWVFGTQDVRGALLEVARTPTLTLCVLLLAWLSGVFHELGHATGCRYSGGRPGAAGVGIYLWWPVLYTNVTDTYRLDRRGRLRTDLGGIYFNAIFTVGVGAAYAVSGWAPLLVVVLVEHGIVVHQFVPWVRLDGFYVISDLTGVPDILSRVRPALLSLIPGRPLHPDVMALRPRARRILYVYLVSFVMFVLVVVVPALLVLPRTLAAIGQAIGPRLSAMGAAAARWDTIMVVYEGIRVAALALPVVGLTLLFGNVARRAVRGARLRRRRRGRPVRHRSVRPWLDASGLAIIEGTDLPGGGAVDYFGFGPGGEVVLFGEAAGRRPQEAADRLVAAARQLRSFSSDMLDRLLLEGPPFVEVVAGAARRAGRQWDEEEFRRRLDDTLARGDLQLLVLQPSRFGTALRVYPLLGSGKSSQN